MLKKLKMEKDNVICDRGEQYRRNCLANENKTYTKIKKTVEKIEEKKNRAEYLIEKIPTF